VEWIKPFFDTVAPWWGRPDRRESDVKRAKTIERLAGPGPKRILDLGTGSGSTAAAMADLGHSVTAVELSPVRAAVARDFAAEVTERDMVVVEADLYTVELDGTFDLVTYWNGFGVGTDADQRRLLRRVSKTWLEPGGVMIMDVYSPWAWARIAGETERTSQAIDLVNFNDYDPVGNRFVDEWWPADDETRAVAQFGRCYTPPDLLLLLEGTGLRLDRVEVDGTPLDLDAKHDRNSPLWHSWDYRVTLVH